MTRFCMFLLIAFQFVGSTASAEFHITDAADPWLQQDSVFDNLRLVSLTTEESIPNSKSDVSRIPATDQQQSERQSDVKKEELQIQQVQYDFQKINRLFKRSIAGQAQPPAPVLSLPGFLESDSGLERTYEVSVPRSVDQGNGAIRQGTARSKSQGAAQNALGEKQGATVTVSDRAKVPDNSSITKSIVTRERRGNQLGKSVKTHSAIPRSAYKSIPIIASGPLNLNLEIKDPQHKASIESSAAKARLENDVPPTPIVPGAPPERESDWDNASWTLDMLADEKHFNPCEPYYCRQMWSCAGGRCPTWVERMMRDMDRTKQVTLGRCRGQHCVSGHRPISRIRSAASGQSIGRTEIATSVKQGSVN